MRRRLSGLLTLLLIGIGCSPAAPPASVAGPERATTGAATAAQADTDYRQRVIEGARAEGQVNAALQSAWTPEGLRQLEDAIEREYGVRIKINFTPVQIYPQRLAELTAELAAGLTPSFDLHQTATASALRMLDRDLLEPVNWAALLPQGTPPAIVKADNRFLVVYTDHIGLMYDPTVISEAEVPRSIKDLSNPRWRSKVMLAQYADIYTAWITMLGREQTLAALRAAVQNGAITDIYANEYTRFAAKEYPMAVITSTYYLTALKRGIPAAFASLDFAYNTDHYVAIPRRAAHPNAAKLLAAVLVGPEGQRIAEEHLGISNRYYEGSVENRLEQAALAAGFPSFTWWESAEVKALVLSAEGEELSREIDRIFKGG
ncbi:MAG TPA: extracellular solute-binding protein [Chloroflexota bacterium]|jgi:iron(III) transport system substrate-binding protein|nr:extracellular solute-binding protein [Chloroflexota bacterium]